MNLSVRAAVWAVMRPWIGAAGTLVLSACQAQVASTPGGLPSASAAEGPMELTTTADALPPGTYTRSGFEPPITLELDEGWRAVQLLVASSTSSARFGTPDVIAVQFARPMRIWSASITEAVEVTTAQEAADALAANDRLVIHDTSKSQLGGVNGTVVDVENAGNGHEHVMELAAGELGIDAGRRLWVGFYDTEAGPAGGHDRRLGRALAGCVGRGGTRARDDPHRSRC